MNKYKLVVPVNIGHWLLFASSTLFVLVPFIIIGIYFNNLSIEVFYYSFGIFMVGVFGFIMVRRYFPHAAYLTVNSESIEFSNNLGKKDMFSIKSLNYEFFDNNIYHDEWRRKTPHTGVILVMKYQGGDLVLITFNSKLKWRNSQGKCKRSSLKMYEIKDTDLISLIKHLKLDQEIIIEKRFQLFSRI